MTTGMMSPSSFAVLVVNALQKSMMLTPACPSAGPTGGAGVAFPAGICSLICPVIFFMTQIPLKLLDLQEVQFHRCGASEDRDHHLERVAIEVDLLDDALEVRKRPVDDAHA